MTLTPRLVDQLRATQAKLDDGRTYTVQYFERNRFEHYPELAGTPYEIQLGQLGRQIFQQRYGR